MADEPSPPPLSPAEEAELLAAEAREFELLDPRKRADEELRRRVRQLEF